MAMSVQRKGPAKKTFNAHKAILASGSEVFEKMFYGPMAEKRNPIVIEDDDPEAFDMLLKYIYGKGDKLKGSTFLSAWKYRCIGDKYLLKGIADDVERFINSTCIKVEDIWDLYEYDVFTEQIFNEKISGFLQEKTSELLKSENFLKAPETFVRAILLMDKLNVSEFELLNYIAKWGNVNFASKEKTERMMQLLQHVRFSLFSVQEFLTFTDNFPDAINEGSCVKIIKHLYNKYNYKLPDWCSTKDNFRYKVKIEAIGTLSNAPKFSWQMG